MKKREHFYQGSLTVEAAVAFPLYLFFFMALLSVMEMMHFAESLRYELSHAAKEIAVYASAQSFLQDGSAAVAEQEASKGTAAGANVSGIADTVLAEAYTDTLLRERLPQGYRTQMGVSSDISLLRSRVLLGDDIVDLAATYGIQPRCNVFRIPEQRFVQRARTHAWTGYDVTGSATTEEGERIVYITPNGSVYHLSRSCTHIKLDIRAIPAGTLDAYRSSGGARYKACEYCGAGATGQGYVFITTDGNKYHSSLSCSGLKRTVYEVPISQVGDRRACSRCGGAL